MCARLLACPLCSQPGFMTLDALRAGLVSVATRPLDCPVCNEVLLGIDKLTIHLFGHSISPGNAVVGGGNETAKIIEVRNAQTIPFQSWNVLNAATAAQAVEVNGKTQESARENTGTEIYIPIDEIETFRNLTTIKDAGNVISVNNAQNITSDVNGPSQVIFLQNVTSAQSKIFSTGQKTVSADVYQTTSTTTAEVSTSGETSACTNQSDGSKTILKEIDVNGRIVQSEVSSAANGNADDRKSYTDSTNSQQMNFPPSHTDRLADLVKNAQITASPLGTFHDSYDCSKPEKPTLMKPNIKSTRILSASERTERCNVCGFHFPDKNILLLHKQLVHMIQAKDSNAAPESLMKNYPCHLCTKVFKMRGSLMVHMRVAHPKFNMSCSSRDAQQKKEQKKDPLPPMESEASPINDIEGGYNCPVCGKSFRKEQHVVQHLRVHEGKQWECDICSKMFTTKYFLKKHKRLHSGEMPYKCNLCDKTFTFQQSFHKHRLYHKDDKPHTCMTCGRSFKELSTLHNHERIHTGEKPFACETCGKCFRQRVSYLVHRRIHTGVMPYMCEICGKRFRYKVSQRTHKCPLQSPEATTLRPEGCDKSQDSSEMRDTPDSSSQDEQSMDTPTTNEENQYILILNENGNHVLKRKRDVESENKEDTNNKIDQNKENSNESSDFLRNIWNQETNDGMDYRGSNAKTDEIVSSVLKDTNLWNESSTNNDSPLHDNSTSKQFIEKELANEFVSEFWNQTTTNDTSYDKTNGKDQSNNTADFFSLIMSPLENELSSPSAEMKHLRLSSPVNIPEPENTSEAVDCFPPMNNNINPVQVDNNSVEENFSETNGNLSTLQTINEDSLKELLNSIVDK